MAERSVREQQELMKIGQRSREDIVGDIVISARTEEATQRCILEVLLDIRDLLKESIKTSDKKGHNRTFSLKILT